MAPIVGLGSPSSKYGHGVASSTLWKQLRLAAAGRFPFNDRVQENRMEVEGGMLFRGRACIRTPRGVSRMWQRYVVY
jgi:hypothetical protein